MELIKVRNDRDESKEIQMVNQFILLLFNITVSHIARENRVEVTIEHWTFRVRKRPAWSNGTAN